jgi:hypothetical protein
MTPLGWESTRSVGDPRLLCSPGNLCQVSLDRVQQGDMNGNVATGSGCRAITDLMLASRRKEDRRVGLYLAQRDWYRRIPNSARHRRDQRYAGLGY